MAISQASLTDMGQRRCARDIEAAFVFLLDGNVGGCLVDPDAESLEFSFNDPLVCERLVDVENNKDQMASFCNCDDLTTSTTAVLGAFNNTRQVDHLQRCSVVGHLTRHTGQGCEFVCSRFRMLTRKSTHQRTLSYGGKADEAHTRNSRAGNIETLATATATTA